MSSYPSRLTQAIWVKSTNQATAVSNIGYTSSNGVAVPKGFRDDTAHIHLSKNCTATIKLWGYANFANTAANWAMVDTLMFSEADSEVAKLSGVTAFDRLQPSINAIGSGGAINISFGFGA
jgi:hypothetical protein